MPTDPLLFWFILFLLLMSNGLWFFWFRRKTGRIHQQLETSVEGENQKKKDLEQLLKTSSESNRDFLRSLMHEIRHSTMLSRNMRQMLDLETLNENDKKIIMASEKEIKNLSDKLEAITEAFQWQSGEKKLEKKEDTLKSLYEFCLQDLKSQYPQIKSWVHIRMEPELSKKTIVYDPFHLKRAFVEILKNSIFFNKSPKIRIDIHIFEEDNNIVFDITDNGLGIREENREKIFDLLWVGPWSRDLKSSGLGTGLTIAKGIVKLHGGDVFVKESSVHEGTTMRIILTLS